MNLKKAFLILAFAMVSIIALLYGIDPPWFDRTFFGVDDRLCAISGHGLAAPGTLSPMTY